MTVRSERYSCWEKLITPGTYAVEVRPVNRTDQEVKGEWVRSGDLLVDSAMAAVFQGRPVTGENGQVISPVWPAADGRWWYDWGDGTWPADCWEEIQGKWYFFKSGRLYENRMVSLGGSVVLLHRKGLYAERLHHGGRLLAGSERGVDTADKRDASGRCNQENKRSCPEAI